MLRKWMPPEAGVEPLALFRTLVVHKALATRMRPLGAAILGHGLLEPRDRELMIDRTCARCGAEYEWGVHATFFGPSVGLTERQLDATVTRPADALVWSERDARCSRSPTSCTTPRPYPTRPTPRSRPTSRPTAPRAGRDCGLVPHDLVRDRLREDSTRAMGGSISGMIAFPAITRGANDVHIDERLQRTDHRGVPANEGRVGGPFEGGTLLLLHHVGARTGTPGSTRSCTDATATATSCSPPRRERRRPDWYHNLKAHPNTTIEVGTDTIDVAASEATGEERDRLYSAQAQETPQFAEYEAKTDRVIPVIVLTPTE